MPVQIRLDLTEQRDVRRLTVQKWLLPLRDPNRLKALWVVRERVELPRG